MKYRSSPDYRAFTIMEVLVVVSIILVLAAMIFPVVTTVQQRARRVTALHIMQQLSSAAASYEAQNNGILPDEGSKTNDSWQACADPNNAKAWYNSLPRLVGMRGVGDFANDPKTFYSSQNLLYVPGAGYPVDDKKLIRPLFAIAINTKLQRKDAEGQKNGRMSQITNPSQTVLFFDQGLPNEIKSLAVQQKYYGAPKGNGKSFVARYGQKGLITFVDGHTELVDPKDVLTEVGRLPFPPTGIIWCRTPEEDPNKSASAQTF
jgi:type II secretory pathway pseudopilin PulG